MTKSGIVAAFASLLFCTATALAQPAAEKKPAPPPAKPAAPADAAKQPAPPPMEAPKPAPEVAEMFKAMQGTWKCTGQMSTGPTTTVPMEYTMSSKLDLDKFWIQTTMATKKTKANPTPFKFTMYTTYDGKTKKWSRVMVDNMGGWAMDTSDGMKGTTLNWEGKMQGMGMTMSARHVEEMKGPKEMAAKGEMSMDGKTWQPMYEATCKK